VNGIDVFFTDQFEMAEAMSGDFDRGFAQMKETKGGNKNKKSSWQYNENGLFKSEGKVEALATFGIDDGAESVVCRGRAVRRGRVHFYGDSLVRCWSEDG
jgi:hypothetical protein